MRHLRHTPMRGLVAVCVVSGIMLMGCGEPDTEPATEPQEGSPDLSTLQIAVNPEYHQAQKSGMSGSGFIVPTSCAAGVAWQGTFYIIGPTELKGVPDPRPAEPLEGVVVPGCNDTGGTSEPDVPADAWAIEGVDTDRALFIQSE